MLFKYICTDKCNANSVATAMCMLHNLVLECETSYVHFQPTQHCCRSHAQNIREYFWITL